jgi:hypothetical protein
MVLEGTRRGRLWADAGADLRRSTVGGDVRRRRRRRAAHNPAARGRRRCIARRISLRVACCALLHAEPCATGCDAPPGGGRPLSCMLRLWTCRISHISELSARAAPPAPPPFAPRGTAAAARSTRRDQPAPPPSPSPSPARGVTRRGWRLAPPEGEGGADGWLRSGLRLHANGCLRTAD